MKKKIYLFLLSFILFNKLIFSHVNTQKNHFDLTIVGYTEFADGIGRIPLGIINTLKDDIKINFIRTRKVKEKINYLKDLECLDNYETKVSLLTDVIFHSKIPTYKLIPKKSKIKLAFSMFEASQIPESWVKILNKELDAIIVPDNYLVEVYKNSGVKIPIFELSLGLYLKDFLNEKRKNCANKPFIFGTTVSFHERKNHELLIKSFIEEFGNCKDVLLKINGRPYGNNTSYFQAKELSEEYSNITIETNVLSQTEYIKFMNSLDCFINISKGEGFSITPRESLALGIPCIVSNNTAQSSICNSGCIKPVNSKILEPAFYKQYSDKPIGYFFNCTIKDVRKALKDVYDNYEYYLKLASFGTQWVLQYQWNELKSYYLNMVNPKKVILGNRNLITKDFLMTDSNKLYNKYLSYIKKSNYLTIN